MRLKRKNESYNYTGFDTYFKEASEVDSVIQRLAEMRIAYIELSLCIEKQISGAADMTRAPEAHPHADAIEHSELLGDIIKILETVTKASETGEGPMITISMDEKIRLLEVTDGLRDELIALQREYNELRNKVITLNDELLALQRENKALKKEITQKR